MNDRYVTSLAMIHLRPIDEALNKKFIIDSWMKLAMYGKLSQKECFTTVISENINCNDAAIRDDEVKKTSNSIAIEVERVVKEFRENNPFGFVAVDFALDREKDGYALVARIETYEASELDRLDVMVTFARFNAMMTSRKSYYEKLHASKKFAELLNADLVANNALPIVCAFAR